MPLFQNECKCENEYCMQFHFHENQNHFPRNDFTLRIALKQRHKGILYSFFFLYFFLLHTFLFLTLIITSSLNMPCTSGIIEQDIIRERIVVSNLKKQ